MKLHFGLFHRLETPTEETDATEPASKGDLNKTKEDENPEDVGDLDDLDSDCDLSDDGPD